MFDTEIEAEEAREAFLRTIATKDPRGLPRATVRHLAQLHLDELAREEVPALPSLRSRLRHIEAAPFADEPIAELAQVAIDEWARSIRKPQGKLAPAYVDAIVALLSGVCARAVRKGVIAVNPCTGLRLPRERRTHEPWTYLEPHEQEKLLAAPLSEPDHWLIQAALGTGLREGELFAQRLPDLHLDGPRSHLVVRYGADGKPTKGGKPKRIPLFGLALEAYERWLPQLEKWAPKNPRRLIWPGPRGGMRDVGHPLRWSERVGGKFVQHDGWEEALALAGIVAEHRHDGQSVRWHDLRHTCASSLVAGWWGAPWRLEDVKALLRHSSIGVTERYAHLAPSSTSELATRTHGVRVGYGARENTAKQALPSDMPLKPYVEGFAQIHRETKGKEGADTPRVPHQMAEAGIRAMRAGDGRTALELVRLLVEEVPAWRDAVHAVAGEPGWEAAALRLFETALVSNEDHVIARRTP